MPTSRICLASRRSRIGYLGKPVPGVQRVQSVPRVFVPKGSLRDHLRKPIDELTPDDLRRFPVWQYTNSDESVDETVLRAIRRTPVKSLDGRVIGIPVTLANGSDRWAIIGNVDLRNPRLTEHFLTVSLLDRGRCIPDYLRHSSRSPCPRGFSASCIGINLQNLLNRTCGTL
jgi:hypothetical protein